MKPYTQLLHCKTTLEDHYAANNAPIYQTATFAQTAVENQPIYDYTRSGNPTRSFAAEQIAQLEEGQFGFLFASGMAAIATVLNTLPHNAHVIAGSDIYGGTHRLLSQRVQQGNLRVSFVDSTELQKVDAAFTDHTHLILIETPSNPLQKITDIKKLSALCHKRGALLAIDNTFLSPWLQKPLKWGADIVIHSATKHLSGHSDITAGAVVVNDVTLAEKIAFMQNAEGNALAPFESWLLSQHLKTLGLRIERAQSNALKIASYLQNHPKIKKVYCAGLKTHPGYALNQQQADGFGSLISFTTDDLNLSKKIVNQTQLFVISVSFGSLKSLISLPYFMSHASIPEAARDLPQDLVRLAIGIEDCDDLIHDLAAALD